MKQLLLTFLLLPVVLFAQEPEAIREPAVPYDFEVAVPEEKVPTYPYNRGLVLFSENGKSGYRDSLGNVIIPAVYKVLPPFNPDGYVEVAQNNSGRQRGLLDTTGRYLVPPSLPVHRFPQKR